MKTLLRVCACALTLTGCVSVDGTRAQLSSKNENEIKKVFIKIYYFRGIEKWITRKF